MSVTLGGYFTIGLASERLAAGYQRDHVFLETDTGRFYTNKGNYRVADWRAINLRTDAPAGVVPNVGKEVYVSARNTTGGVLAKGVAVRITGISGGIPVVAKAQANVDPDARSVGLVSADIADGADGWLIVQGVLDGLNTTGLTAGSPAYLSEATPGALRGSPPPYPNKSVQVGVVVNVDASTGAIMLGVQGDDFTAAVIPTGAILPYGGAAAPTGFLLCNGALVSQATYAALFAVLGHAYNGGADPGGGNFKLPDLRQRFPLGKAAAGTGSVLGATGGTVDHTHNAHTTSNVGILGVLSPAHTGPGTHSAENPPFQVVNYVVKT